MIKVSWCLSWDQPHSQSYCSMIMTWYTPLKMLWRCWIVVTLVRHGLELVMGSYSGGDGHLNMMKTNCYCGFISINFVSTSTNHCLSVSMVVQDTAACQSRHIFLSATQYVVVNSVLRSGSVRFFDFQIRQPQLQLVLNQPIYWVDPTGLSRTSHNWSGCLVRLVQTGFLM